MNENLTNQIVTSLLQDGSVAVPSAVLSAKVAAAVAGLTKDYAFKGVVHPWNSPGSINAPTCMVACTGGTYRGYSSIVLDQFTISLFVSDDGGVWTEIVIYNQLTDPLSGAGVPDKETAMPEDGMLPNVYYALGLLEGDTIFTLAAGGQKSNHYYFAFDTGAEAPTITWPVEVLAWRDDTAPEIAADTHYEVSILDGVGAWMQSPIPAEETPAL